jgi:hypothetical protein
MANFISLTEIQNGTALPINVNVDHISTYGESTVAISYSKLRLMGGAEVTIQENLTEIETKIAAV